MDPPGTPAPERISSTPPIYSAPHHLVVAAPAPMPMISPASSLQGDMGRLSTSSATSTFAAASVSSTPSMPSSSDIVYHLEVRRFNFGFFRDDHRMHDGLFNRYFLSVSSGWSDANSITRYFLHYGFNIVAFGSEARLRSDHPDANILEAPSHWLQLGRSINPAGIPALPRLTSSGDTARFTRNDEGTDYTPYHASNHGDRSAGQDPSAGHAASTGHASSAGYAPSTTHMSSTPSAHIAAAHMSSTASAHVAASPGPSVVVSAAPPSAMVQGPSVTSTPAMSSVPPVLLSCDEMSAGGLTSALGDDSRPLTLDWKSVEAMKIPTFNGDKLKFVEFAESILVLFELPVFNPGGSGDIYSRLVTTPVNFTQSSNLRLVLMKFLSGAPKDSFKSRSSQFDGKGFEMFRSLLDRYSPRTPAARFMIYVELLKCKQTGQEAVETFCAKVRGLASRLSFAGIELDPMLITMLTIYGLDERFDSLREDFAKHSGSFATKTIDDIENDALNYLTLLDSFGPPALSASAAGTTKGKDVGKPAGGDGGQSTYPSPAELRNVLQRGTFSGDVKFCGYCQRTHHTHHCHTLQNIFAKHGYVFVKDEAAAQKVLDQIRRPKKSESTPAAASATTAPASIPTSTITDPSSQPRPPTPPASRPSQVPDDASSFNSFSDGSVGSFFIQEESAELAASASAVAITGVGSNSSGSDNYKASTLSYSVPFPTGDKRTALREFLTTTSTVVHQHLSASSVTKLGGATTGVCVADSGATDHLFPDISAFISYHRVSGRFVRLADQRLAKIMGIGSVAICLGGKKVVLHNVYHVPALRAPLFSLRTHRQQSHCGFIGDSNSFSVWFPSFSLEVDTSVDSYLPYSAIGRSADLHDMDYVQPKLGRTPISASSAAPLRRSKRLQERLGRSTSSESPPSSEVSSTSASAPSSPVAPPSSPEVSPTSASEPSSPVAPPSSPVVSPPSTSEPSSSVDQLLTSEISPTPSPPSILKKSVSWMDDITYHIPNRKCPNTWKVPPPPSPLSIPSDTNRRISPDELLLFSSNPHTPPPPVRACDTPNESDTLQHLTSDQIYKLFGNRRFRDYESFCSASKDCTFIKGGQPIPSIGEFATMRRRKRGKTRAPTPHYLDLVHMDIVYGDVISRLGYRFGLLLVDRATKYIWIFGLRHLTSANIIEALEEFRAEAGGLPKEFRCDCDQKLLGGETRRWILNNQSTVHGAPAGRQSANGLVERYWQTLCSMARSYLVEKQMSRDYWFFAVQHAARMHNMIPGRVNGRLTTPFELVHRCPPDTRTWFPIFSMVYFYKDSDADKSRSSFQSNAMQGIAVGRSSKTNGLLVYHPGTKKYYEPDTYKFDPSRLPCNEWPNRNLRYDGGLIAGLYRDGHSNVPEPYPPGMPFRIILEDGSDTTAIVSSIPFRDASGDVVSDKYHLQCSDGSLLPKTLLELDELAASPANQAAVQRSKPDLPEVASLPVWLQHGSKVTFDKDGEFHKGFIIMSPNGVPRFSCRRQMSSREESWGVNLPNLLTEWPMLTQDNTLIPSWSYSTFLRPASTHMHINVSHVSACHLKESCPASLRQALASSHPDRDTWLESYYEEKQALVDNDTYVKLSLAEYRRLRRKGASKAIPSMCVLVVKNDENLNPHRAKSRIVVLGNQ